MKLMVLLLLVVVASATVHLRHHGKRRTFPRHKARAPARIHIRPERTAEDCQKHEHHLICGPEKHCDLTCENLFSKPNCIDVLTHSKCWHPRCVCNDGYVRNDAGVCIRATHCPNVYYEPASMRIEDNSDLTIEFKPVKFSRIGNHRVYKVGKKPKVHKPSELSIRI
ncbi:unnamed protein product [Caenorhabditis brenneri]